VANIHRNIIRLCSPACRALLNHSPAVNQKVTRAHPPPKSAGIIARIIELKQASSMPLLAIKRFEHTGKKYLLIILYKIAFAFRCEKDEHKWTSPLCGINIYINSKAFLRDAAFKTCLVKGYFPLSLGK